MFPVELLFLTVPPEDLYVQNCRMAAVSSNSINERNTMTTQAANERTDKAAIQLSPGYLMAPFGWATKPLAAMLAADASLYSALFTLSRQRMHLIALALAHSPSEIDARFSRLLTLAPLPRFSIRCSAAVPRA